MEDFEEEFEEMDEFEEEEDDFADDFEDGYDLEEDNEFLDDSIVDFDEDEADEDFDDFDEEEEIPMYTDDDYTVPESKEEDMAAIQKQIDQTIASQKERFDRMLRSERVMTLTYFNEKYLPFPNQSHMHMDAESFSGVESVAEIPSFERTNLNACLHLISRPKQILGEVFKFLIQKQSNINLLFNSYL